MPRLIDSYNGGPVHCSSAGHHLCSVLLHASVCRIDCYVNAWDDKSRDLKGVVYWNSWWPERVFDARLYRRVSLSPLQKLARLAVKSCRLGVRTDETGRS